MPTAMGSRLAVTGAAWQAGLRKATGVLGVLPGVQGLPGIAGKKKTHCDKNVVIVQAQSKRVGFLSQTYAGKTHDKKIVDTEPIAYPPDALLAKDTGFQGYEPAGVQTRQPKKSPGRGHSRQRRSGATAPSPVSGCGSSML